MNAWDDVDKLKYIVSTVLVGLIGMVAFMEWTGNPGKTFVPGQTLSLDHAIGVVLKNPRSSNYLIFTPTTAREAIKDADLHFAGSSVIETQQISAAPGRVKWRNGRFDSHNVPGLFVHVTATLRGAPGAPIAADTLRLRLPGLTRLGEEIGDAPAISYNGNTPRGGDSVIMQRYRYLASSDAVRKAGVPWLALLIASAGVVLWIGLMAFRRTFSRDG